VLSSVIGILSSVCVSTQVLVSTTELTWDLQVNTTAVSVKLVWIKAGKPVDKTGIATSQAQNVERFFSWWKERGVSYSGPGW
jgi:hypothetical protein